MYDPRFWKPLTTMIWLKYCRKVLHDRLKVECVRKKNIIISFFNQCQRLHEWKDTTYLYMYALIQVFIASWSNVLLLSRGLGRGHSFGKNLGLLTAAKSRNFRKIFSPRAPPPKKKEKTFLPGGRQRNLKSRGKRLETIYVTGRYSAGAHYFSEMDSYLVYIAKRRCLCRGVCRGHITTQN